MDKKIKFGTDGWRGIMADDFTFENVRIVSRAIARYLNDNGIGHNGIVVGYDNRFLSDRFAEIVSGVMAGKGIPVYKTSRPAPTPVTAYAVKHWQTAGAVMLTASHNPPEYNGIKFIPHYAGPALPHVTQEIEGNISKIQQGIPAGPRGKWDHEQSVGLAELPASSDYKMTETSMFKAEIKEIEPFPHYVAHMKELIDMDAIGRARLKVIVDPMYGCGIGYMESLLRDAGVEVHEIQCCRDPLFGGNLPEPTGKLLGELKEWVSDEGAHLGLAMDGDADRFGIIDHDGTYITPNQFLPLLYYHLVEGRGITGPVTRTVATTHMLDRMAVKYSQQVFETAVGFKYIGQNLLDNNCVLGGEESGGLSIKGHIPEKDGILGGLLAAEIVAVYGKSIGELLKDIAGKFGPIFSNRLDIHTSLEEKKRVLMEVEEFLPAALGGIPVVSRITLDGVKFVLEDNSWVLVRPSGTEPLFRIYAESESEQKVKKLQSEICNKLGLD